MSVRKSVFWAFTGQFVSFATALGSSIIVARLLNPHEMGIYAVALATLGVLQMIAAFDMATYVVREKELGVTTLDSAFTVNAVLCCALAFATYVVSYLGAAFLGEPAVAKALQLLALGPLIAIFEFRPSAMLQRQMQFKRISAITTGKTLSSAIVTIWAAWTGHSYMSLAYGNLAYALFGVIAYNLLGRSHVAIRFSRSDWRVMGAFGIRMMSISGLANLVIRLSDIVLGRLLGLAALGLYSRATSISSLIFQNIYGTATKVVFVQLAKDYRERGVLRDTFLRGIQMITALMWPLLIGLALLAKPVVLLMFGRQWLPAATPMALLMIAQFVVLSFGMNWELFVLRDETARQTRFEAIRAVVSLVLFVIGCAISIEAAAASRIAEALVGMALYLPHMNRMAGTTTADLVKVYGQSGLLTIVATLPTALMMWHAGWTGDVSWALVTTHVALGIALWLGTLALLGHPLFGELVGAMRRVIRR